MDNNIFSDSPDSGFVWFRGIAQAAVMVAKVLFFIFLILFVISLILGAIKPK
jgi:uncharacterized membrane protein YtjA (UPF0391 family)